METTHRRRIPHLRMQGTVFGPIFWTVDGRPYPGVARTMQYAVDSVTCRDGQQMSAVPLIHR